MENPMQRIYQKSSGRKKIRKTGERSREYTVMGQYTFVQCELWWLEKDLFRNLIERGDCIKDSKVEQKFLSSEPKQLGWIRAKSDLCLLFIFWDRSSLEGSKTYCESSLPFLLYSWWEVFKTDIHKCFLSSCQCRWSCQTMPRKSYSISTSWLVQGSTGSYLFKFY